MTQTVQLKIQNVSCEACEKVIGRLLGKFSNAKIESISKDASTLTLTCEENDLPRIREKLVEYNYLNRGIENDFDKKSHASYIFQKVVQNHPGFQAENELLTHTILIFAILIASLGIVGWVAASSQNNLFTKLWPMLVLIPVGIAVNSGALLHVKQLRQHFNCTNGMMAGMIIGMIAGFMSGALIGATNGMFVGSVVGMAVGMGASAYAVRKTGIMGILEGLMAGLMAGTMGAMLSVMMITDNLIAFLYILFGVCTLILLGMSYFMIKEIGPIQDDRQTVELFPLALQCLLVLAIFVALAVWGPKSAIAFGAVIG